MKIYSLYAVSRARGSGFVDPETRIPADIMNQIPGHAPNNSYDVPGFRGSPHIGIYLNR